MFLIFDFEIVLDIYLLPSVYYSAANKEKLRNLTLALEQILILLHNKEIK